MADILIYNSVGHSLAFSISKKFSNTNEQSIIPAMPKRNRPAGCRCSCVESGSMSHCTPNNGKSGGYCYGDLTSCCDDLCSGRTPRKPFPTPFG
jgi:hypothetical protein